MIIRPDGDTVLFITQPDHALVAEAMLDRWIPVDHPRRGALLLAAREHDGGWQEPDETLVFDETTGSPLDFVGVPDRLKQAVWPVAIERLEDRYAAALVARHAAFVYAANRDKPSWQTFFADMERREAALLQDAGVTRDVLDTDYPFVAVVDLASLAFCHHWTDDRSRFDRHVRWHDDALEVTPTIFADAPAGFRVRARRLPVRRYGSAAEARAALAVAPVEYLEGLAR